MRVGHCVVIITFLRRPLTSVPGSVLYTRTLTLSFGFFISPHPGYQPEFLECWTPPLEHRTVIPAAIMYDDRLIIEFQKFGSAKVRQECAMLGALEALMGWAVMRTTVDWIV